MRYKLVPYNPTTAMTRAASKSMSPGNKPTEEWVSNKFKHTIRYQAMLNASPDTGLVGLINKLLKRFSHE